MLEPPAGSPRTASSPTSSSSASPTPTRVKNRLHLDLRPDDQAAEVARLEALGATRVDIGQGDDVTWVVLADPEGNEFCVLQRPSEGRRDLRLSRRRVPPRGRRPGFHPRARERRPGQQRHRG